MTHASITWIFTNRKPAQYYLKVSKRRIRPSRVHFVDLLCFVPSPFYIGDNLAPKEEIIELINSPRAKLSNPNPKLIFFPSIFDFK